MEARREIGRSVWSNDDFGLPMIVLLPSSFGMEESILEMERPK